MTRIAIFARLTSFVVLRSSFIGAMFLILIVSSVHAQTVTRRTTDGPTPSGLAPGVSAGSYALSGFDNVNFATGSLNFALPLLTIGGRGTAQYTMMLPIERHWSIKSEGHYYSCGGSQICFSWDKSYPDSSLGDKVMPGYGPGVMQGRQTGISSTNCPNSSQGYSTTLTVLTFTTPDGSAIEFRDTANNGQPLPATPCGNITDQASRGTVFTSTDGSAMTFTSDLEIRDYWQYRTLAPTGYLMMRDGTRYRIVNGAVSWIRDRNGNQISFLNDTAGLHITDPLGRTVNISYRSASQAYDDISFTGFNGTIRHIRIGSDSTPWLRSDYQALTWPQAFPELNSSISQWPGGPEPSGPGYVEIPDGRRYRFYYNPYGELARVELPTTGAYEYDWASGFGSTGSGASAGNGSGVIYRRVITRRVYKNGGTGTSFTGKTTIDRPFGSAFAAVKAYDAQNVLLAHTDHYYYGDPSYVSSAPITYPAWNDNREYKTDYFATNGTTLLRSVSYTWQPRVTYSWAAADPRLVETVTTLTDTNQVSRQTSINPQGGAIGFDQYNNQTDTWEYDFSSGAPSTYPRRHTHTDYLATNPVNGIDYTAPTGAHQRELPRGQQVYSVNPANGSETLVAQSTTAYDEPSYPLLTYTTASGWTNPGTGARGNATTGSQWLNTNSSWLATHAQYDQLGNVRAAWDAKGNLSQVAYNDSFSDGINRNTFSLRTSTTSAVPDPTGAYGSATVFTSSNVYDFATAAVVSTTDINNQSSSFQYNDLLDRPTQFRRAVGATITNQTTVAYDDVNRTITTSSDLNSNNDNVLVSKAIYDGLGRTIETRQYEGGTNYIAVQTQYDALGRAYKTSNPFRPWQSENAIWTTTGFDALGRAISVTTPDNAVVNTYYRGNQVLVKDQLSKERMSQTNALGQLTDVWEITAADDATESVSFLNHPEVVAGYRTKYNYDTLGNLTNVTQQKGTNGPIQTRTFIYNSLSQLTDATNPESGHILYDYDANGNLLHKTDARPLTTTYAYDALNRNTTVNYSNTTIGNPDVPDLTRIYDGSPNGKGRLWESYAGGTATVGSNVEHARITGYDALGRPLSQLQEFKTNGVWGSPYTTQRGYNLAGGVTGQTYPSERIVTYAYDAAGRTNSFTGNLGEGTQTQRSYSTEIIYSPLGGMTKEKFGTDPALYNKLFYNSRGQLSEIREGTSYTGPNDTNWERGAIINYYSNSCWGMCGGSNSTTPMTDNNGNLKKQEVFIPGTNSWLQQYDYDNLNRLQRVHEYTGNTAIDWQQEYVYDRYGNRTLHQTNTWGAGINKKDFTANTANNNRLGVPGGQTGTMTYDAAGNLTTDTYSGAAVTRVYDAENHMTSETQASNYLAGSYTYNADGQRVRRKINGVETWQVYGMDGELLAEYAANAAAASPQKEYGYRNGQLLITADITGAPPVPTFSDDFNDNSLDPAKWSVVAPTSPAVVSETGQRLQITLPPNTATYNGIYSNATFDLTGKSVQVEVAQAVSQAGWCENFIQVVLDANNYYMIEVGTSMVFRSMTGGVNNQTVISYTQSAFPYWRIRHDQAANTINLETSSNGTAWITRKTVTAGFSLTALRCYLYAGAWGTGNGSPGAAKYDNFQLVGNTPATVVNIQWLVADQLGTPRMVFDKTGVLANVKRHDYLPFGEELSAGQGARSTLGYGAADGIRQKFTQKERDIETGLDYFGARYYASAQGRFTGADNIVYSKAVDPQTWNQYAYCRNGPLSRIDVDGHNWFLVHHKKGDAWEWHDGKKTKAGEVWVDKSTGKSYTSKYTNLIVVSLTTRTSYAGANYGTVTLYGKGFNDVKARDTYAFAGGSGKGNEPPAAGEYFINLAKVGKASEAWAVNDGRLANFHGFQYIPEITPQGTKPQGSWGHMRANLSKAAWVDGEPVFREGNSTSRYLHGHENSRGFFGSDGTLGCVATPDEHVLNYLSNSIGKPQVHPQVPVSVKAPQ